MHLRQVSFLAAILGMAALLWPTTSSAQSFWTDSDARKAITLETQVPVFRSYEHKSNYGLTTFWGLRWPLSRKVTLLGEFTMAGSITTYSYPQFDIPTETTAVFGNPLVGIAIQQGKAARLDFITRLPLLVGSDIDDIKAISDVERFGAFAPGVLPLAMNIVVPMFDRKPGYRLRFNVAFETWIVVNRTKFGEGPDSPFLLFRYGIQFSQREKNYGVRVGISGYFFINEFTFAGDVALKNFDLGLVFRKMFPNLETSEEILFSLALYARMKLK